MKSLQKCNLRKQITGENMSTIYHVNPETNRPNICRAKKNSCSHIHFDSKEQAQAYIEETLTGDNNVLDSSVSPIYSLPVVEVDKTIAEFYEFSFTINEEIAKLLGYIKSNQKFFEKKYIDKDSLEQSVEENTDKIEVLRQKLEEKRVEIQPFTQRFNEEQWTRAFLVVNANGHVHKDMNCSSCFPSTRYEWKYELSGKNEEEIIALAGERACTLCYPQAPVEVLKKPTSIYGKNEQTPEEKEAKKRAQQAKKFTLTNPETNEEIKGEYGNRFKTKRGAELEALSHGKFLFLYGLEHPSSDKWIQTMKDISTGLAALEGRDKKDIYHEFFEKSFKSFKRTYKGHTPALTEKDYKWEQ